jgi:hypothetical protein
MPSRGGQNRPLPDTRERLNKSGQHDSAALYQERRRQPPKNERAPAPHRQPDDQHEEARLFAQQGVQPEVQGGDGLGQSLALDGEKGPGEGNSSSEREQLNGNSDSRATGARRRSGRGGMCQQKPTDSRPSFGRGFEGRRRHSPTTLAHKAEAGAAHQQDVRLPRHLEAHTGARGGFGRGARQGEDTKTGRQAAVSSSVARVRLTGVELRGTNRPQPTPTREQSPSTKRVHFGQGDISSLFPPVSQEILKQNAQWADAFGWSRPLHESLPWEDDALEAGSAGLAQAHVTDTHNFVAEVVLPGVPAAGDTVGCPGRCGEFAGGATQSGVTDDGSLRKSDSAGSSIQSGVIDGRPLRKGTSAGGTIEAAATDDGSLRNGDVAGGVPAAGDTVGGPGRCGEFAGGATQSGVTDDGSLRKSDSAGSSIQFVLAAIVTL